MLKKALTALVFILGLATAAHAYELLGSPAAPPPPPPPPPNMACAIGVSPGPLPSGAAAADVAAAGFNTCALNSDWSSAAFATASNWLSGPRCTYTGTGNPVWFNSDNGTGHAAPCSDYNIITDGANGQVLDMTYSASDYAAGSRATQLLSVDPTQPGVRIIYPTGMYVEWKGRFTPGTLQSYSGNARNSLFFSPFKYVPNGSSVPSIEVDLVEGNGFNPNLTGFYYALGTAAFQGGTDSPVAICGSSCSSLAFLTTMHTYGVLVTTDGANRISLCTYYDATPGTVTKLGCVNYTNATSAQLAALEQLIIELGPQTNLFTGDQIRQNQDALLAYFRVFTCGSWNVNQGTYTTPNVCSGPLVTN